MSDFSAAVHRVRNNTVDTILVPIILFRVYLMAGPWHETALCRQARHFRAKAPPAKRR